MDERELNLRTKGILQKNLAAAFSSLFTSYPSCQSRTKEDVQMNQKQKRKRKKNMRRKTLMKTKMKMKKARMEVHLSI